MKNPLQPMGNKILLMDDHPTFIQSMRLHLELYGFDVLEASNLCEAERAVLLHDISLIITDFNLGKHNENGLMLLDRLCEINTLLPVILVTMHYDPLLILKAISCGIKGFMLKDNSYQNVLSAIHSVREGRGFLCEKTIELMKKHYEKETDILSILSINTQTV